MVDVDPRDTQDRYTPREPTIVDAVAEAKRIADSILRSNPLKDATIGSGLTKWTGNYGGDLVWIGEFQPYDPNLVNEFGKPKPQRGVTIVRDDPKRQAAFYMYDWYTTAGVPLRQKIGMGDADGRTIMREGKTGGVEYPMHNVGLLQSGVVRNNTSSASAAWCRTPMVGRHLEIMVLINTFQLWPVQGAPGFGNVNLPLFNSGADAAFRVTWNLTVQAGSFTVATGNTIIGSGSAYAQVILDLGGGSGPWDAKQDYMLVDFNAWVSAGDATRNGFHALPVFAHNYTRYTP